MSMSKLAALALAMTAYALAPSGARAQAWPSRPVTMVVPFPAGGSADVLARAVAQDFSERLGQQFVVENRAGAGGNLGGAAVAKAAPDGATILFATPGPAAINKLMYKSAPYDPVRDLVPAVLVAKSPVVIVANPHAPVKDFKEMVAYAKANPGKLNVGHPGNGTIGHITSELLQQSMGIGMTNVPYRGGAPLMSDLMGGQVHVGIDFITTYIPLVKEGKLRAFAVTTSRRAVELPDTPTVQELGFAGFEASAWYTIMTPTGTSPEVGQKINAAINAYLQSAKGRQQLATFAMQAAGGTPADAAKFIAGELAKWGPVIKAANISLN
jgi:tripartite-type tricarboxylate transporter receptor subunit TctC